MVCLVVGWQVGSLGLTLKGSFDVDLFNKFMGEFLEENSANLFRSKGVLSFKDQARKYVFQVTNNTDPREIFTYNNFVDPVQMEVC